MRHYLRFSVLILTSLLLFSCQPETIHESSYDFKNSSWNSFEKARFTFTLDQSGGQYDLYLNIIYTSDYPAEYITFASQMKTPGGEERLRNFHERLRTKDEIYKAYKNTGVFEKKILLGKDYSFQEKGTYKLILENRMSKMQTPGIKRIELEVIKH
ncbi:MAG: hypothetical protein U5Q03_14105 [Bacteroidota bacterium]|nr:hypothetical protein [Bacteroidota bacterium]